MNQGEARAALERVLELGHEIVPLVDGEAPDTAEAVLLFTCDVIQSTEKRMWRRMEEVHSSGKQLFVAGCVASVSGRKVLERFPGACVLDTMGLPSTLESIRACFGGGSGKGPKNEEGPQKRVDVIVPISTGCIGNCSYCLTKLARGGLLSYPEEDIIARIERGLSEGKKEVLLTCQDTAAYGLDMDAGQSGLGGLLRSITRRVKGPHMVRVGMMNPATLRPRMEEVLSGFEGEDIFKFFHIPLQSGSDKILSDMGRGHSIDDFRSIVERVRERYPRATLSTDIIVGFPGETAQDHEMNIHAVEALRPEILNITRFSRRRGTRADVMKDQVHGRISKELSRELTRLHRGMLPSILGKRLGIHKGCLVTEVGKVEGTMMARDQSYLPIVIDAASAKLGEFVDIETCEAGPTYLKGKVVGRSIIRPGL